MSRLESGSTLCDGRYRLEEIVGRGGMAMVWRAHDLQLERDVAIKVISDVLASDPSFVARFEREARLAAALVHPNLVKLFDYSVDSERPFLVMEYVPGGTLSEARSSALDLDVLARDLLDALAHIHAAGIVHRDIKPANVLLGPDGFARLTDFGIARGNETSELTQTGQVLGTLRYIAPEVAAGEPATPRSDLYSLGVLLDGLSGDRSEPLNRLIKRMTESDPRSRPASATEALTELEATTTLAPTEAIEEPRSKSLTDRGQSPTKPLGGAVFADRRSKSKSLTLRGQSPTSRQAVGAAVALLLVLLIVIAAASGGGSDQARTTTLPSLAPAGAPAAQQFDSLERAVRAVPGR